MSDTATTKELDAPTFTTNPTTVEYSFTVGGSVITWVTVPSYVALQEKVSIEIKTFENLDLEVGVLELTIIAVAKDSLGRIMCTDTNTVNLVIYDSPSVATSFSPVYPQANETFEITTVLTDSGTISDSQEFAIPAFNE